MKPVTIMTAHESRTKILEKVRAQSLRIQARLDELEKELDRMAKAMTAGLEIKSTKP